MLEKLKSNSGETITEVLIASLVVVLGVLLYSMMVISLVRIINTSNDKMKEIYSAESALEQGEGTSSDGIATFTAVSGLSKPGQNTVRISIYKDASGLLHLYKKS